MNINLLFQLSELIHWKSGGSPADWGLVIFFPFSPFRTIRSPTEVQRKSVGLASPASPTIFCFKVTSPDFHRTWTGQAAEFGQVRQNPLEVRQTVRWVCWNWQGPVKVHRNPSEKGRECKVHQNI